MMVKASAVGKLMRRTLGFSRRERTAGPSGAPLLHTTSTLPSFTASTAADPAKGSSVAVSEFTPPLPSICSAEARVPLPIGPTAMRFPFSCESRSLFIRGIKNPKWVVVYGSQRQQSWRMFFVRDTSEHKGNLDTGFWILQKLDVFHGSGSLA